MLQNAYLLAKIGADTAENERNLAEILPIKLATALRGRPRVAQVPRDEEEDRRVGVAAPGRRRRGRRGFRGGRGSSVKITWKINRKFENSIS